MAYIHQLASGNWKAEIEKNGVRMSRTRPSKKEVAEWATREEAALQDVADGQFPRKTFAEAMDRYSAEVSVNKAGARFEALRLGALKRDFPALAGKALHKITTADMAAWRDARLKKVTKGSVQRDVNLLSNLFTIARKEWGWCGASPLSDMRAPGENPSRDRLPTRSEVRRILRWLGYTHNALPTNKQEEAAYAFLLALHTGMRAGEILQLSPTTVAGNVATVNHKMQYRTGKPRRIPLSGRAVRLLGGFKGFTITSESLDAAFRKCRDSMLIDGLHFHDSRASALTRLSTKIDVLELARVSGHKDLRILNEVYYRKSSEDIGHRL